MVSRTSIRWQAAGLLAGYVGILLAVFMDAHVEHPVSMALFGIVIGLWGLFYNVRLLRDWYVSRGDYLDPRLSDDKG